MTTHRLAMTHLSGPLKGEPQKPYEERILVIGRSEKATVKFPPEFTAIGREHCEIHLNAGRYEIWVSSAYRVLVNGKAATDGQELPDEFTLELGPKSEVVIQCKHERESDMPPTDDQRGSTDDVEQAEQDRARGTRIALLLLLAVIATGAYIMWSPRQHAAMSAEQIAGFAAQLESKRGIDFSERAPELAKSVLLVVSKSAEGGITPMATAWVVGESRLATNAHVAIAFDEAREQGMPLYARTPGPNPVDYRIERVEIHPAFTAFKDHWDRYQPTLELAGSQASEFTYAGGYDVALMYIAGADSQLPPALPIADRSALLELKEGQEVAFIGYPMEGLVEVNVAAVTPEVQRANITSMTDFFRAKVPPEKSVLLKHSLPISGGASGSPMFDMQGRVIGLVNGANMVFDFRMGTRTPHAAAINFGQRVDLLMPLLEGKSVGLEELEAQWKQSLERFASGSGGDDGRPAADPTPADICSEAAMLQRWREQVPQGTSNEPQLVIDESRNMNDGQAQYFENDDVMAYAFTHTFEEASQVLARAESKADPADDIDLFAKAGEQVLGSDFQLDGCPYFSFEAAPGAEISFGVLRSGGDGVDSPFVFRVYRLP